jgi:hypothetical protein
MCANALCNVISGFWQEHRYRPRYVHSQVGVSFDHHGRHDECGKERWTLGIPISRSRWTLVVRASVEDSHMDERAELIGQKFQNCECEKEAVSKEKACPNTYPLIMNERSVQVRVKFSHERKTKVERS